MILGNCRKKSVNAAATAEQGPFFAAKKLGKGSISGKYGGIYRKAATDRPVRTIRVLLCGSEYE